MERDIRKEITEQVFDAINREVAEIDKRIKQHEKWCLENNADSRDGIHIHMCEKMALSRLYPTLRTIRGDV
jgi:hypothetical protein